MIDAIRAEWLKIVRNVRLTSSLVWSIPIGAATFLLIGIVLSLVAGSFTAYMGLSSWTNDLNGIWGMINGFPLNILGRMLPLSFMATMFAGEFQWETWRQIVPRSNRTRLVAAKLITAVLVIMLALAATSIVMVSFQAIAHAVVGAEYGPALTGEALSEAARSYFLEALIAFLSLLILGAFAAVAAFITRSILGALLLSMAFSLAEVMSLGVLAVLSLWFDRPGLLDLYRYMPNFNLENLRAWVIAGHGAAEIPFGVTVEASMGESLVFVGLWIAAMVIWAVSIFRRQDISA